MATKQMKPRSLRAPDSLWNWIRAQARAADRPINWMVNKMLEDAQKKEQAHG